MASSVNNQKTPRGQEPPMYLQRPSTGRSQDVRHILARTFRDLYTRDSVRPETVKNLQISKGGDDPYHERYVENLQKVHTEWRRRMDEAAMLERHIMQAQARSMSADERELNKASMSCDNYSQLGLPPVRAHFRSCIDSKLLQQYNLLTPSDYIVQEPLPVPAPQDLCCDCWKQERPKIPDYARGTTTSRQHSRQNSKLDPEVPISFLPGESMELPSYVSDMEIPEVTQEDEDTKLTVIHFPKKSGWKEFTSEDQRDADRKILDMMQAKINFLQNPRHVPTTTSSGIKSLLKASKRTPKEIGIKKEPDLLATDATIFLPSPSVVEFKNYIVGEVYEITLELKNMSTVMRNCRVLPPTSNIFSVGLGQFPGESGLVAPGMSCKYDIRFAPDSLKDYDDQIFVQTQSSEPLIIPLKSRRKPPVLTLPNEIDLGSCLVGGMQATQLLVKNEGGPGRFCLMSRTRWPTTSIRTVIPNITKITIKQPPFEIHPATFELGPGQSTVLEVLFSPQMEKTYIQEMTIACDNCHASHFKIRGEGEIARVGLSSVERGLSDPKPNELNDISAKNLLKFDDLNPFTYTERTVKVCNYTKVELPFQWMVYKPIMPKESQACLSGSQHLEVPADEERVPDLDSVFSVFPTNGILQPSEKADFKFTFAPPIEGQFHSVIHMLLQHVPPRQESIVSELSRPSTMEGVPGQSTNADEESNAVLSGGGVLPFRDLTGLEMEVKGECIPLNVVLHPYALFVSASTLVGSTVKRLFTMANHSYSAITFQWEPFTDKYLLEVEPPFGELDPGMAMDLEVSITGVEPGTISHTLQCYIMNLPEPLHLHVEADFKGPELKIMEPSINFGLVQVGGSETKQMTIVNTSQMVVKYNLLDMPGAAESDNCMAASDLSFTESSGQLNPLERKTLNVTFTPTCPRQLKRVAQLEYEGGETCHIAVYGEAQNPLVCFLECDKVLPEVYLNVPVEFKAILHNQTLLPTTFQFCKVEGTQKDDCVVEVMEKQGMINSWEQKKISISFTPLKAMSYSEVRIPCKIKGQEHNLYLNLSCDVQTLSVTYTTSTDSLLISENLLLNFGEEVGIHETVKRYVHIGNQTAISAPFTVSVEYFSATLPSPPCLDETYSSRGNRRSLLSRTPNIADPLSKTPLKAKEAYNKLVLGEKKGAAFVPFPASGTLKPFEEQIIEITAYSDMWGNYKDNIIFKVGDLEEMSIPLTMCVKGCPISFQLTSGAPGQKPVVRFGTHVSGVNPINRKLKVNNCSPKDVRVDWQIYNQVSNSNKLIDFITYIGRAFPPRDKYGNEIIQQKKKGTLMSPPNMDIIINTPDTSMLNTSFFSHAIESKLSSLSDDTPKIISCFVRPHEGVIQPKPYTIKPPQMIIPANSCSHVDLTFTPLPTSEVKKEMDCFGCALGFLSLDNDEMDTAKVIRPEAYDADFIKLDFTAHLKPALLTVEETSDEGMTYRSAMSDVLKSGKVSAEALKICSTMLSNNTMTPLTFRLKVEEPFTLVDLDPGNSSNGSTKALSTAFCNLNPRHNLMVKVAFKISPTLLQNSSDLENNEEKITPHSGKKVEFSSELLIQFDNGAEQSIPLNASLAVPQMEISQSEVNFGTCLVGQMRMKELVVSNKTASHSHWSIHIDQQSENCSQDTFKVSPLSGMLDAHITHVSNSKSIITLYFTAKHSEDYHCTFRVQGMLGEETRHIHVFGSGSYDGKHESILNV